MTEKKNPNLTKSEALVLAWKSRKDYKGYDRSKGSAFNSWRSIITTQKGLRIGYPNDWRNFDVFMSQVQGCWEHGKIVRRFDTSKPYSKENAFWAEKGSEKNNRLIKFTFDGVTKTLLEWSRDLKVNYNGLRIRYFRHKNDYTPEEILFGKAAIKKPKLPSTYKQRIVRCCGAYKLRDKKHGFKNDIDSKWLEEFCKQPCCYCGDTNNIGLDRIDNTKGHTKDNVVPCCYECNCARMNNFSVEEMKIIGKAIREVKCNRLHKKI